MPSGRRLCNRRHIARSRSEEEPDMAMAIELVVVLWLLALGLSIDFFVKSLDEAIAKGREEKQRQASTITHLISPRHPIPTGHGRRRPAH